jgi:hypothetical protein
MSIDITLTFTPLARIETADTYSAWSVGIDPNSHLRVCAANLSKFRNFRC